MNRRPATQLTFPQPDIAELTFDLPGRGANIISRDVLDELELHFDALEKRNDLAGLIVRSGKPGMFIAGADVKEFASSFDQPGDQIVAFSDRGRSLFQRLSTAPFVTVCAIDGICVGGGAELAVWCDRRVFGDSPKALFGFPEVKLGLIPGWGGTVRTPRIVGLNNAIELITRGETINGRAAVQMGLGTDVLPSAELGRAALQIIRDEQVSRSYLLDRQLWSQPAELTETELQFLGATASAFILQQTKGHNSAPLEALEVLLTGSQLSADEAAAVEAKAFASLFGSPLNRALVNVFLLSDRNKKDSGLGAGVAIKQVGVLGAGIMGSGISAACIKRDLAVVLTDVSSSALVKGVERTLEEAAFDKSTKSVDPQKLLKLVPLLKATSNYAEVSTCDLVIEAIVENLAAKTEVYRQLEPLLKSDAVLASNTSAISIASLGAKLREPSRFIGIHFFNPVRQMPLVEIIRGPQTSDETVASALAFAKGLGKATVVVQDGPGFLVNRLLFPYMNEALELVLDGMDLGDIDALAEEFGMPMGPINLFDVVGLDTALFAGNVLHEAFPDRIVQNPLLSDFVKAGRLGKKSGRGFYQYAEKRNANREKPMEDPSALSLIEPLRRHHPTMTNAQGTGRLFLPMLLEATRILAEGKVDNPRDVNLGVVNGIGFPPSKGGLLFWADTLGAAQIIEKLKPYESLGERYHPTPLLKDLATSGGKFYDLP